MTNGPFVPKWNYSLYCVLQITIFHKNRNMKSLLWKSICRPLWSAGWWYFRSSEFWTSFRLICDGTFCGDFDLISTRLNTMTQHSRDYWLSSYKPNPTQPQISSWPMQTPNTPTLGMGGQYYKTSNPRVCFNNTTSCNISHMAGYYVHALGSHQHCEDQ